jgi:hypothetical protein
VQARQVIDDCTPNGIHVDTIILVAKPIADPADVAPRQAWAEDVGLVAQAGKRMNACAHARDSGVLVECAGRHTLGVGYQDG